MKKFDETYKKLMNEGAGISYFRQPVYVTVTVDDWGSGDFVLNDSGRPPSSPGEVDWKKGESLEVVGWQPEYNSVLVQTSYGEVWGVDMSEIEEHTDISKRDAKNIAKMMK